MLGVSLHTYSKFENHNSTGPTCLEKLNLQEYEPDLSENGLQSPKTWIMDVEHFDPSTMNM